MKALLPAISVPLVFCGAILILVVICGVIEVISFLLTKIFGKKKTPFPHDKNYDTEAAFVLLGLLMIFIFFVNLSQ